MRLRFVLVAMAAWNCGGRAALVGGDEGWDAASGMGSPDASPPPKGGRDDANAPPLVCGTVTGRWAGTWKSNSDLVGTWQTDLVETAGGALSGNSVVTGTQCGTTSTIIGKRAGCSISFGLSSFGGCTVEFVGTLEGREMSGTYTVTEGLSDQGRWSGSKR